MTNEITDCSLSRNKNDRLFLFSAVFSEMEPRVFGVNWPDWSAKEQSPMAVELLSQMLHDPERLKKIDEVHAAFILKQ